MLANRVHGIPLWHCLDLQEDWHSLPDIARQIEVDATGLHPCDGRGKWGGQGKASLFGDLTFCAYLLDFGALVVPFRRRLSRNASYANHTSHLELT